MLKKYGILLILNVQCSRVIRYVDLGTRTGKLCAYNIYYSRQYILSERVHSRIGMTGIFFKF